MTMDVAHSLRQQTRAALAALFCFSLAPQVVAQAQEPSSVKERATPESRCAKPWCRKARFSDRGRLEQPQSFRHLRPFSVGLGLGAAWFGMPEYGVERYVVSTESGSASAKSAATSGGDLLVFALPTLSLGLTLQQPLAIAGSLPLHLEQRFSVTGAQDWYAPKGAAVAGFGDFLLGAHFETLRLSASAGVGLGLSHVDFGADDVADAEPTHFILAALGLVRFEPSDAFPGVVVVSTRQGKLYDTGHYRDLQLTVELAL